MELDDMKLAWQTMDHRLGQQHALNVQLFRDGRMDKLRRGLRPLIWGQALQMLIGVLGLLIVVPIWTSLWRDPAVLISGVVMHIYCVGLIVFGGIVQGHIAGINYAAPVLEIQRRLLKLRRIYAVWGAIVVGLPWWFLTAPLLVVLTGGQVMTHAPSVVWINLAIGAVGLPATWWFHRWSHRPERAELGRKMDANMTGASIRRAQATLEDIARFERD